MPYLSGICFVVNLAFSNLAFVSIYFLTLHMNVFQLNWFILICVAKLL